MGKPNFSIEQVAIHCPNCGNEEGKRFFTSGVGGSFEETTCTKCGSIISQNNNITNPAFDAVMNPKSTVTCPFCQSTNCKKISGASKIGKVALFGVFAAGSVSKTWHCNNCGSNFG